MFSREVVDTGAVTYMSFAMGHYSGDFSKMELTATGDAKVKYFVNEKIVDAMPLPGKVLSKYIEKVLSTGVLLWDEEYIDDKTQDGTQWELEIRFADGGSLERYGSNKYPDNWKRFLRCVNGLDIPDFK